MRFDLETELTYLDPHGIVYQQNAYKFAKDGTPVPIEEIYRKLPFHVLPDKERRYWTMFQPEIDQLIADLAKEGFEYGGDYVSDRENIEHKAIRFSRIMNETREFLVLHTGLGYAYLTQIGESPRWLRAKIENLKRYL